MNTDDPLVLNRSVVIVKPRQPYRDWAAGLAESGLLPDDEGECTIYLIPDFANDEDAWEILEEVYDEIFNKELWSWHTDPAAWPLNRTFSMFRDWFHVGFHSVVEDLCDYELFDEDVA